MSLKNKFKKNNIIRSLYYIFVSFKSFVYIRPLLFIKQYLWFIYEVIYFKKNNKNNNFKKFIYFPCLFDNLKHTPLDPIYFFQDSWAAKKIFELNPEHHYDIGSSAKTIGILSQFTPITMVDIRPIELSLPDLFFKKGTILDLPFEDNSIDSLSSLCVVEHIGLGRYGDSVDSFGSEKSINEIKRVLTVGGIVLFSVPVDNDNKIYFNAHRAFTRDYILELFDGFNVIEEKYQYGNSIFDDYDLEKGLGTGMYMLKKEK